MEKSDITQQLVQLRDLFKLTGGVHEGQLQHLKYWPYIIDNTPGDSFKSECKIDLENQKVFYEWTGSTQKVDKNYQKRLKELEKGVKFLFGDDFKLQVQLNGSRIFPLDGNTRSRATVGRNSRKRPAKGSKRTNPRRK
jgi:hypothetical protein